MTTKQDGSEPLTEEQREMIEADLSLILENIQCDLLDIARKYLKPFTLFRDHRGKPFTNEDMLFEFIEAFCQKTLAWFIETEQYKKAHTNLPSFLKQRMAWRTRDYRKQLRQEYGIRNTSQLGEQGTEQYVTAPSLDKSWDDLRKLMIYNPWDVPDFSEDLRPDHRAMIHVEFDEIFNAKGITDRDRQLLTLRFAENRSPQQIADMMGLQNANVASKEVSKALKKIRKKARITPGEEQ